MRSFTIATAAVLATAGLAGGVAQASTPSTTHRPGGHHAVTRVTCQRTLAVYPHLRQGDRGPAVRTLQCLINDWGWTHVTVDGVFGPKTAAALERIRLAQGMGKETRSQADTDEWTALFAHRVTTRTLKRGDRGQAVIDLQRTIRATRTYITVDGVYGPQTEDRVKQLQRILVLKPTGRADAALRALLLKGDPYDE